MIPTRRLRVGALLALAVGHLAVSLFAVVPGYLSIDEATYHLTTKYLSETGGFEIWNGYRELPSPELVSASLAVHDGALVGQPPAFYSALTVPFYRLAGYRGMFALNAIAFAGAAGLLFLLARRLFSDTDLALDAVLVMALGGFAWEQSQAAWTHATALLFTLGAFTLAVLSWLEPRPRRGAALALAAGTVAGLGVGIRLDCLFALAAILLLFLFRSPWLPGRALAAAAGAVPPLALLAAVNQHRFGTWSPLSMGAEVALPSRYPTLAALAAAALFTCWLLSRRRLRRRLGGRRAAVLAVTLIVLAALAVPTARDLLGREVRGVYTLGVDLRALDLDRREPAMLRSDNRAVLYIGGVKKALLQSCPYLVLLLLPALRLGRQRQPATGEGHPHAGRLALLYLVPAVYLGFYAQYSWHGGLGLNLRYLVPILPYTSLLTAYALRQAAADHGPGRGRDGWLAAAAVVAVFAACGLAGGLAGDELQVLTMPLALAGALLVALLFALRGGPRRGGRAVAALAAAALVWSCLTAFVYDMPRVRETRRFHLETGRRATELVAPDSLFFADFVDPFFLLIEHDRVRIARPGRDRYRDMPKLAAHHLEAGRGVFGAFPPRAWEILAGGPLAGFSITPLWRAEAFTLARIEAGRPPPASQASRRPAAVR